jgi:hypothetical protein
MIAHVAGVPVEELLPLTGGGLMLGCALLRHRLRESVRPRR